MKTTNKKWVRRVEDFVFGRKQWILTIFAALSLVLLYQAFQIKVDAGFEKQIPLQHPYMQTFTEYKEEFGQANRLLIALHNKNATIFEKDFLEKFQKLTDEVFFLPGVNRSTVQSLFTPNVRFIEIVEGGFTGGNVVPAEFSGSPEDIVEVRENVLKAGIVGRLVSNDFRSAMISAQLVETNPQTGEKLDYFEVANQLENKIREKYEDESTSVHIIGFAKAVGDVASGASGVVLFFAIAFLISIALVYYFTLSLKLCLLPIASSLVAVIWTLGLLVTLGFGLDPMSILVPFLVFAIGVSHGVQMVNSIGSEISEDGSCEKPARRSFRRLLVPGIIALLSDTVGFISILLIDIGIIQELAITASLGVAVIILTNMFLLPLIASSFQLKPSYAHRFALHTEKREKLWVLLSQLTNARPAMIAILVFVGLFVVAAIYSTDLKIGDLKEGVPELRPDSRYNQDSAFVAKNFAIGVDILNVLAVSEADACIDIEVMGEIDRLEWELNRLPEVQSTLSLVKVAKRIWAGWNEGHLKWRSLPRNPQSLVQAVGSVETSTGLLNKDCSVMPIVIFTKDHRAETIKAVVNRIESYQDSEKQTNKVDFRLATGNVGVMVATNEVVEKSQLEILIYIYLAVFVLCLIAFRSFVASLCILIPLSFVSVLSYALMAWLGIGLKVSTLPVAAMGVGIGVDYGIYIFSRLKEVLKYERRLILAYQETLRVTGNAVLVTGLTLSVGVSTWIFSDLQFQADMGILLTFMFLSNMVAALIMIPALARFLYIPAWRRGPDQRDKMERE